MIATGLFYGLTGIAAIPLMLAWAVLRGTKGKRRTANAFLWVQAAALRLIGIRTEVTGLDRIPQGPVIFAAQHESAWETMHFTRLLGNPAMFAKAELFDMPLIGWVARRMGHIPLARGGSLDGIRASLRQGADAAAAGRSLLIFPSGTRRASTADIRAGVGVLYQMTDLPVVPVRVSSGHCWPARGWPLRPGTIRVELCPPIPAALPRADMLARLQAKIGND